MSDIMKSGSQMKRKWYDMEAYSAGAVSRPTLYKETLLLAGYKSQGFGDGELKRMALEENILKFKAPDRMRQISSVVLRRLDSLSAEGLKLLEEGTVNEKKMVVILSILKTDRLFREFMTEVYLDKLDIMTLEINDGDFERFFAHKREQSEKVDKWTDATLSKLRQVYKKMLVDLSFAKPGRKSIVLLKPLISREMDLLLKDEIEPIKKIFRGRDYRG